MDSMSVGELKARFSEVLERIKKGERIVISYGKRRKKVAILVPYKDHASRQDRKIGLLRDRGRCVIHKDFKIADDEMLQS